MKYWPLSDVARHITHDQTWDVMCAFDGVWLPEGTLAACAHVARQIPGFNSHMLIIETTDGPMRRCYSDYPEFDEWLKLERSGFIYSGDFFGLVIDALH